VVFSKPDTHSKRIAKITDPAANGSIGVLLGVDSTVTKKVGWMQVTVPSRSNKLWGWARVRDLSGVRLRNWIEINTASHKLAVVQGTKCVRLFPVAVGTKSTPTPKGIFFINDRIKAPNAAYGHWLLSVSAYSPAFVKFGGLDAAIGIHGTNEDGSVGKSASHGCVRMHIRDSDWLYPKIPPGTPVIIS
jgi:lipoprotein-anchoring transpeptidase ErfK/SrfK